MLNFKIGAIVRVTATFTNNSTGDTVDPSAVFFSYKSEAIGSVTTLTYGTDAALVRESQGVYYVDVDTTPSGGNWRWRFWSTGTGADAFEDIFYVKPNPVVVNTVVPADVTLSSNAGSSYVGFIQEGTGATPRTAQDKLRETVSIKDFGGVGNGISDNLTALNTATTAYPTGYIYFPAGTYLFSDEVTVPAGCTLGGNSRDSSIMYWNTTGHEGLIMSANTIIEHMCVRGPGVGSVFSGTNGIDAGGVDNVLIDDCIVELWPDHNINTGGNSTNWTITNNIIRNAYNDGILSAAGDTGHLIEGNRIYGNGSIGVDLNSSRNRVIGNFIYSNGANYAGSGLDCYGVNIDPILGNADDNLIADNHVYSNSKEGIRHRAGDTGARTADRNAIIGNIVRSNGAIGIYIDSSSGPGSMRRFSIIANQVSANLSDGILVGGGSSATVENGLISNNIVVDNTGTGINVPYGTDTVVSNNVSLGNGTQLTLTATRTTNVGNKSDNTTSAYTVNNLGLDTITVTTAEVTVTSTGNTQLTLASSGGGGRRSYSTYIDTSGNYNIYDVAATAVRVHVDSAGQLIGAAGVTVATGLTHTTGATITSGNGAPGGACVTGSIYQRRDGGTGSSLYVCESSSWVAK